MKKFAKISLVVQQKDFSTPFDVIMICTKQSMPLVIDNSKIVVIGLLLKWRQRVCPLIDHSSQPMKIQNELYYYIKKDRHMANILFQQQANHSHFRIFCSKWCLLFCLDHDHIKQGVKIFSLVYKQMSYYSFRVRPVNRLGHGQGGKFVLCNHDIRHAHLISCIYIFSIKFVILDAPFVKLINNS